MLYLMLFLYFLSKLRFTDCVVCTINTNYVKAVTASVDIFLCKATDCRTNNVKYLETAMAYFGCVTKSGPEYSSKREVRIKLIRKTLAGNEPLRCFEGTWTSIVASQPCQSIKDFTFQPYPTLNIYDVYIVSCGEVEEEFPNGDAPRIQIFGFDNEVPNTANSIPVLFPTQTVKCVSSCTEVVPTFTVSQGAQYVTVANSILFVKPNDISIHTQIPLISAVCASANMRCNLTFDIANNITGQIMSQSGGRVRSPEMYDAGEMVSCYVFGASTRSKLPGSPPESYICLVTLDSSNVINKYYTAINASQFEIPEGLLPSESYHYYCFFGNASSKDVYQISMDRITIGARFKTKLSSSYPTYEFDFPPGTKISCDTEYYKSLNTSLNFLSTSISASLYIIYAKNTSFPMSHLQNYISREWDNATTGTLVFNRKFQDLQMYVFCTINLYTTTPRPIFAGDRPSVNITYLNPRWKTDYLLRGFVLVCTGVHITDIDFTCLDCLPDMRLTIQKLTTDSIKLTVPYSLRKNIQIKYRCTGYSDRYDAVSITLPLYIIVSEYTDIDTRGLFFWYTVDYIQCISQFTIPIGTTAVKQEIIMPIQVQIDGEAVLNLDGKLKSVLLRRQSDTSWSINFQACCPPYGSDGAYSCLGRWKIVKVARNYYSRYNLEITEIFPGNLLKCFICVNYTFHSSIMPCTGENKINSLISITVIYPDGRETYIKDQMEVHAPVEELKPDKEGYYKITDYHVKIGCKVRGLSPWQSITMKSCNLNPPKILINPPDKTMFLVGDIFSCTTEAVNCKNGLAYTIYVQRGNDVAEKKDSHSFTLALRHIGNNILIKCAAGEGEASTETRLIRVEAAPYNVSIQNLNRLMVYGNYFRCNSLGFPPSTITWTQLKGGSLLRVSESFLLIGPWDFPGDYMIQCEAKNKRGSVTTSANFKVFNPRIIYSDYSVTFYFFIPFLTFLYLLLMVLCLLVIFQETFFGVPFFSQGGAIAKSSPKATSSPVVPKQQSIQESMIVTHLDSADKS